MLMLALGQTPYYMNLYETELVSSQVASGSGRDITKHSIGRLPHYYQLPRIVIFL